MNGASAEPDRAMRLLHVTLPVHDPAAAAAFYRRVLGLPVEGRRVRAGWTRIDLVPGRQGAGSAHLAFNIPPGRFEAAVDWLWQRAELLGDAAGRRRFRLEGAWKADSVYFAGPDDAVLELIARAPLGPRPVRAGAFDPGEILCLSEVGLPSANVPAVVEAARALGIAPLAPATDAFAPLGGYRGLLIVVDRGRPWFPEGRRAPWARGMRVALSGPRPGLRLRDAAGWEAVTVGRGHDLWPSREPPRGC